MNTAEEIRQPAEALGDRIHFTGPVRADRLVALYRGADLLAFPSLHEGFGLPVLEAMAQSTAVLCSDIPVLREVAGNAARFVDPNDADAWAAALGELLHDDDRRAALASAGRVRAAVVHVGTLRRSHPRRLPRRPRHLVSRRRPGHRR